MNNKRNSREWVGIITRGVIPYKIRRGLLARRLVSCLSQYPEVKSSLQHPELDRPFLTRIEEASDVERKGL